MKRSYMQNYLCYSTAGTLFLLVSLFVRCTEGPVNTVITDLIDTGVKEYNVERDPATVRYGFGMDIYRSSESDSSAMYLSSDTSSFGWDLLFYNEYTYTKLSTGDYSNSGDPVIFMNTDTTDGTNTVSAVMIGQGISCFKSFSADSISALLIGRLKTDRFIKMDNYRTDINTTSVNGRLLLAQTADSLYSSLVIGKKFRPNTGGVFSIVDASDPAQIELQPVFLIKTREGRYAKFMVTRFKGTGGDTKKLTLMWQLLE